MTVREKIQEAGATRMGESLLLAVLTSAIIWAIAPQQLEVLAAKVNQLSAGAWLGYWADRFAFPMRRPHMLSGVDRSRAEFRRAAMIIGFAMAMALAL